MIQSRAQIEQSLRAHFDRALKPQLQRLPRPDGYVLAEGQSGYGRASGYLLGACERIVEEHRLELGTTPHFAALLGYAFSEVYGAAGEALGLASIDGMKKRDPAIHEGNRAGRQDLSAMYAGTPGQPMAFHDFATFRGAEIFATPSSSN